MVIRWSEQAVKSLRSIYKFYQAKAGNNVARKIVTDIRKETYYLLIFPEMGSKEIINGHTTEYRYIVKNHCKIFYTPFPNYILIAFIWDTRRNPQLLQDILLP